MFLEGMGMRARQCGIGIATTWGTQPVWEELVGLKRKTRWQSGAADTPACTKLIEMGRRDERHRRNDASNSRHDLIAVAAFSASRGEGFNASDGKTQQSICDANLFGKRFFQKFLTILFHTQKSQCCTAVDCLCWSNNC